MISVGRMLGKEKLTRRQTLILSHDLFMTALAVPASFVLRYGAMGAWGARDDVFLATAALLPVAALIYWRLRTFASAWRFVSTGDVTRIISAALILTCTLMAMDFVSRTAILIPRTVPAIYLLVQVALLVAPRVLYRLHRQRRREREASRRNERIPILIAGAGPEADNLIRRVEHYIGEPMQAVALLSHKAAHIGDRIRGVPVMGRAEDLELIFDRLRDRGIRPKKIIFTQDFIRQTADLESAIISAKRLGLTALRVPARFEGLRNQGEQLQLAQIQIEDLLGRSTHNIDVRPIQTLIEGRRVLVTGAGGSIGSELARQISAFNPFSLVLLDNAEFSLYSISKELRTAYADLDIQQCLANICDRAVVWRTFERFRPELVFHAAALKHVDIVENHPLAATATNALGTRNIADAAASFGALGAIFISTDKAVNPVSVLGATKRAGELYWAASNHQASQKTNFVTVRFGNVLGSSGSVIPLFTDQLSKGGPLTVTHPDVERYFMTIPEAVRLVLTASSIGTSGLDFAPIYVLDMGQPIKIVDLARQMIRLAGYEPDRDIKIVFTGLRPGERLTEYLEYNNESLRPTAVAGIQATDAGIVDHMRIMGLFSELEQAVARGDEAAVIAFLSKLIPEYAPAMAHRNHSLETVSPVIA